MQETLKKILKEKRLLSTDSFEIVKLCEHASYRAYFRIILPDQSSFIVMKMPQGLASVSEEITNYTGDKNELPFVNIQKYLESIDLPVPKIHAWIPEEGLMILEDLGDRLLETYLKDTTELLRISFYKRAIDLLVEMQQKTTKKKSEDCIAFHRSFDENLLNWELDHFLEYGIEDRFQIKIPENEKSVFNEFTRKITREIIQTPYCFVHRDFQSRNLILKDYNFYLLDFQDALLGPPIYDLVALTRDSYIELSMDAVQTLLEYFIEKRRQADLAFEDENKIRRLFHLVTLQRKLKDTGRFQFIHTVKKNSNFLVSVPSSLRYIRQAFEALPEFEPLRVWIAKYVEELK
ncbi:MAG: phosphotransferase [Deltaproteobacteria bacterium]|nr:phosphotransferase [Deltaproteobacteria bacterium]